MRILFNFACSTALVYGHILINIGIFGVLDIKYHILSRLRDNVGLFCLTCIAYVMLCLRFFGILLEWGLYSSVDTIKISNFQWGLYSSRDTIRDGTLFKTIRYIFTTTLEYS